MIRRNMLIIVRKLFPYIGSDRDVYSQRRSRYATRSTPLLLTNQKRTFRLSTTYIQSSTAYDQTKNSEIQWLHDPYLQVRSAAKRKLLSFNYSKRLHKTVYMPSLNMNLIRYLVLSIQLGFKYR